VEKNLLVPVGEDALRFSMLETIREYGAERLDERGEADEAQGCHIDYLLALLEARPADQGSDAFRSWARQVETEYNNLRGALTWCLDRRKIDGATKLTAAIAECRFWYDHSYLTEARRYCEAVLEHRDELTPGVRVRLLKHAARFAWLQGDLQNATRHGREALRLTRELGDRSQQAWTLLILGSVSTAEGDFERTQALHEEALSLFRETGDIEGIEDCLNAQGYTALFLGDLERAESLAREAQRLGEQRGDHILVSSTLRHLGLIALQRGNHREAATFFRRGLALMRHRADRLEILQHLEGISCALAGEGRAEEALCLWAAAEAMRTAVGVHLHPREAALLQPWMHRAQAAIGEAACATARDKGRAMTPERAIACALDNAYEGQSGERTPYFPRHGTGSPPDALAPPDT
jgi:tetratricopeptide (TPR) repeat protein